MLLLERLLLLMEGLLLLLLLERLLLLLLLEWLLLLLLRRLLLVYSQNDYLTCIIIFAIIQIKANSGSRVMNEVVTEDFQFFLELIACCTRDFDEGWILGEQNGTNSLCGGTDGTSSCVFGGHIFLVYCDVLLIVSCCLIVSMISLAQDLWVAEIDAMFSTNSSSDA
jgi:hypothetical protein